LIEVNYDSTTLWGGYKLRLYFDSTGVRRAFDCLPKTIKVTAT